MMNKKKCCTDITNKRSHTAKERRKKLEILNPDTRKAWFWKVDNCLIQDQENRKCDFMCEVFDNTEKRQKVVYFELKGRHFQKGISQLENTIKHFKEQHLKAEAKKAVYIGRGNSWYN